MSQPAAAHSTRQFYLDQVNKTVNCVSIASVFALHLLLAVGVLLVGDGYRSYDIKPYFAFYNALFFVTLFWSVHETLKPGPLQMATVTNLVSIVFDIIVACTFYGAGLWFLIVNILFRPLTSFVLLRRAYERKRRFALHANENVSLGDAIRNLLYNQQPNDGLPADLTYGKDPLGVFSTIASRDQNNTTNNNTNVNQQTN